MKIALVTGANRGIGKAIASILETQGCIVFKGSRTSGGDPGILRLDVTDRASIESAKAHIEHAHGKLDILINNAGVLHDQGTSLEAISDELLWQTLDVNLFGVHRVSQSMVPLLKKSQDPRIINLSSRAGQMNEPMNFAPAYCISKSALNALTIQQSIAWKGFGISVNCMSPGWVATDMGGREAPLSPEEGADTAVWLALEAPKALSGRFLSERLEIPW